MTAYSPPIFKETHPKPPTIKRPPYVQNCLKIGGAYTNGKCVLPQNRRLTAPIRPVGHGYETEMPERPIAPPGHPAPATPFATVTAIGNYEAVGSLQALRDLAKAAVPKKTLAPTGNHGINVSAATKLLSQAGQKVITGGGKREQKQLDAHAITTCLKYGGTYKNGKCELPNQKMPSERVDMNPRTGKSTGGGSAGGGGSNSSSQQENAVIEECIKAGGAYENNKCNYPSQTQTDPTTGRPADRPAPPPQSACPGGEWHWNGTAYSCLPYRTGATGSGGSASASNPIPAVDQAVSELDARTDASVAEQTAQMSAGKIAGMDMKTLLIGGGLALAGYYLFWRRK